jgi:hypothetical protein
MTCAPIDGGVPGFDPEDDDVVPPPLVVAPDDDEAIPDEVDPDDVAPDGGVVVLPLLSPDDDDDDVDEALFEDGGWSTQAASPTPRNPVVRMINSFITTSKLGLAHVQDCASVVDQSRLIVLGCEVSAKSVTVGENARVAVAHVKSETVTDSLVSGCPSPRKPSFANTFIA